MDCTGTKLMRIILLFMAALHFDEAATKELENCSKSEEKCAFPFTHKGVLYKDTCVPGFVGDWCLTDGDYGWAYCGACESSSTTSTTSTTTSTTTTSTPASPAPSFTVEVVVPELVDVGTTDLAALVSEADTTAHALIDEDSRDDPVTEGAIRHEDITSAPVTEPKEASNKSPTTVTTKPQPDPSTSKPIIESKDSIPESPTTTTASEQAVTTAPSVTTAPGVTTATTTTTKSTTQASSTTTEAKKHMKTVKPRLEAVVPATTQPKTTTEFLNFLGKFTEKSTEATQIPVTTTTPAGDLSENDAPGTPKDDGGVGTVTIVVLVLSVVFVIILVVIIYLYVAKLRRSKKEVHVDEEKKVGGSSSEGLLSHNKNGNHKTPSETDQEMQPLKGKRAEDGAGDCDVMKDDDVKRDGRYTVTV